MSAPYAPKPDLMAGEWLLLAEAAAYANVPAAALECAIVGGRLPGRRVVHRTREDWAVHSRDLEVWVDGGVLDSRR